MSRVGDVFQASKVVRVVHRSRPVDGTFQDACATEGNATVSLEVLDAIGEANLSNSTIDANYARFFRVDVRIDGVGCDVGTITASLLFEATSQGSGFNCDALRYLGDAGPPPIFDGSLTQESGRDSSTDS